MPNFRDDLQRTLGDNYSLERELGGGGMSRVFVAEETTLSRKVVVKVLPSETAGAVSTQRFKREIQVAARLHHPHIVPVLSAGEMDGVPYYTMPFVSDETLRSRLARGPMPFSEVARILREVASALVYAHKHGIVHRDIKPENVLMAGDVAAVTDFGVAKAVSAAVTESEQSGQTTGITSFGVALGTPAYMSPEQASADPNIDHRADIYAFGVMAYEMICGAPPFAGRPTAQMLAAQIMETPEPISKRRTDTPAPLASLVMRCLEKSPDNRPQSADEIIHALDDLTTPSGGHPPHPSSASIPVTRGRSKWPIIAAAAVVVALAGAGAFALSKRGASAADTANKSIAVLPFTNMSGDKSNDYFSDGITQEINDALAKVPGLRVAAQGSASAAKNKGLAVPQIAQELGVGVVLQGSVQRAGDRVRITAQLVNAADGFTLWSDKFDREIKDVFAVQDEIAKAIVNGLRLKLIGGSQQALVQVGTADPEAHSLYLQGLYFWNRRTASTILKAITYFEQAIARDSTFAAAWTGKALGYAVQSDYADVKVEQSVEMSLAAARRALALDSTSAAAYAAIGIDEGKMWRNAASLAALSRAIAIDSNYATAHHWRALQLARAGQFDEAVASINRARAVDPLSLIINSNVGRVNYLARRFPAAEAALRHTIELDPNFAAPHEHLGAVLLQAGKYAEAVSEFQKRIELTGARPTQQLGELGHALAVAGRTAEARAILQEIVTRGEREPISHGSLAMLYSGLGEKELALKELAIAVKEHDTLLYLTNRDVRYDALRADPRGAALFAQSEGLK